MTDTFTSKTDLVEWLRQRSNVVEQDPVAAEFLDRAANELDLLRRIAHQARTVVLEDRCEFAAGELPDIDELEKLLNEWRPLKSGDPA